MILQNRSHLNRVDFQDTFEQTLNGGMTLYQALDNMFYQAPRWILTLLEIRNFVTRIFGLQSGEDTPKFQAKDLIAGQRWGFIEIININESEACFRGDDSHLNFIVYFKLQNSVLSCLTQVEFNNVWGRWYFTAIAPFHKIIVPALLKAALRGDQK